MTNKLCVYSSQCIYRLAAKAMWLSRCICGPPLEAPPPDIGERRLLPDRLQMRRRKDREGEGWGWLFWGGGLYRCCCAIAASCVWVSAWVLLVDSQGLFSPVTQASDAASVWRAEAVDYRTVSRHLFRGKAVSYHNWFLFKLVPLSTVLLKLLSLTSVDHKEWCGLRGIGHGLFCVVGQNGFHCSWVSPKVIGRKSLTLKWKKKSSKKWKWEHRVLFKKW